MLVEQGGSDLLLVENAPPCARVEGEVRKLEPASLDGAEIEAALLPALSQHALRLYRQALIADSSYRIEGLGRFRINLHRERGRAAAAIRALPAKRSEEHTSELQSQSNLVCRLLPEKKKTKQHRRDQRRSP